VAEEIMKITSWQPRLDAKVITWLQVGNHPRAKELLPTIWNEALELCHPETWVHPFKREAFFQHLSPYAEQSKTVCRLLADAAEVFLLVATIGEELECRARSLLTQRESFHGYILDRLGSFLIEDIITYLDNSIEQQCRQRGMSTTRRYSPGYRDFSIEAQYLFVELAGDNISCLHVDSNHILKPEKSITALKGCTSVG
jgi:hypothetical protein